MASPFIGGPERQVLGLAEALRPHADTVFLSFAERGLARPFLEEARRAGFEAIELRHNAPHLWCAAVEVADHVRRTGADILCCNGYKPDIVGWLAARRAGVPVLAVSHGWTAVSWKVRLNEAVDRWVLRRVDYTVCVSEGQAVKVRRAGVPEERLRVIQNAVRTEAFDHSDPFYRQKLREFFVDPPRRIVGAAGRISPEKGFDQLVEAAVLVIRDDPDVGFVLFGDGPLRADLTRRIVAHGLERRFILAGFRTDLERFLPHLDVVTLPSYTEGLPVILLEACAAGVPVVATSVGGTPEVIEEGQNGYLVPAGDPAALALRLGDALRDEGRRAAMGQSGRQRVRSQFTFAVQGERYRRLFGEVIEHHARALGERAQLVNKMPHASHSWWLGLGAAVVLALALRLMAVDFHSFWCDETFTADIIKAPDADLILGNARDTGNPPLYWLTARWWSHAFGDSEVALRSLSVLCSVAAVPLLALLGQRLLGSAAGLFTAFLFAISPLQIELADEARTYALLHLIVIANGLFFVRWVQDGRRLDLILLGVTTCLGGYSHYYALLLPLAQLVALLVVPRARRLILPWAFVMSGAALLWLPWLGPFCAQLATPGNLSRNADSWAFQFLATPVTFALGRTFAWRGAALTMLGLAALGTVLAFGLPLLAGIRQRGRERFALVWLLCWLLIPIVLPLLVAMTFVPIYGHRYATVGLPAFLLLVGAGLAAAGPRLRLTQLALIASFTAVSLFRFATVPLKDDWRAATPAILARLEPGTCLLFDPDYEATSFDYYARRIRPLPNEVIGLVADTGDPNLLLGVRHAGGQRVDRDARDHSADILSAPEICLVQCVPDRPLQYYAKLFQKEGYVLKSREELGRIGINWFVRTTGLVPGQQPAADETASRAAFRGTR
jgi:glycosyltransferase involved in cell wall biosynthesis/4-amino-4-deoxy-L-arabinose transferase-like glycosyltransferase